VQWMLGWVVPPQTHTVEFPMSYEKLSVHGGSDESPRWRAEMKIMLICADLCWLT